MTSFVPVRNRDGPLIESEATSSPTPPLRATDIPRQTQRASTTPTPSPTRTTQPTATSTVWPFSPIVTLMGPELVDFYRIWDGYHECGADGDAHDCMMNEPDALILTRIAIGEAPSDVNDQVYVMWLIRLRAELGFKNNRFAGGWCGTHWCYQPGRWGERTTIRDEALCVGGCQFSPARVATHVYFPCLLSATDPMRKMLCPTDNQLSDFDIAYRNALAVLASPLSDFPEELRGYDNFRSPSITGPGQHNRVGGMDSVQFWPAGNIWRDEFVDDNYFWNLEPVTPTPRPVATSPIELRPTATRPILDE